VTSNRLERESGSPTVSASGSGSSLCSWYLAGQTLTPPEPPDGLNERPLLAKRCLSASSWLVIVITMSVLRSVALFILAAVAEIGGAWLVWQGVREHRGLGWIGAGIIALSLYGFVTTLQPDPHFGRILAAYGGVFVAGSLAWGMILDGFKADRYDISGALICLAGVAVIMYAPRGA
jgi:small multidrug resistance family-3 protein